MTQGYLHERLQRHIYREGIWLIGVFLFLAKKFANQVAKGVLRRVDPIIA